MIQISPITLELDWTQWVLAIGIVWHQTERGLGIAIGPLTIFIGIVE